MVNQKCILCGSLLHETIYEADQKQEAVPHHHFYLITENKSHVPSSILKCRNCGLLFVEQDQYCRSFTSSYAEMVDTEYITEEAGRRKSAKDIVRQLDVFKGSGRSLIEIGCSTGFFLDEARRGGWDVCGVELSRWAVRHGREKFNLKLFDTTLEKLSFPSESFDVVCLQHVIEHLEDPITTLKEVERILVPGGLLYISTPDILCFFSRLLRKKWWGISPFHLYYFSSSTLKRLLTMFGFRIIKRVSFPRTFTVRYWSKRIAAFNPFVHKVAASVMSKKPFCDISLKINLHDELNIFAKKKNN